MRVPSSILRKMKIECGTFASDESGAGVSDYGAIFALLMMVAGLGAGWFLLSSSTQGSLAKFVEQSNGGTPASACAAQPVRRKGFSDPCEACGGG